MEILIEKTEKICCLYIEGIFLYNFSARKEILNKITFQHNYFQDENSQNLKKSYKNTISDEENKLIDLEEDEKESLENNQSVNLKKRHSLLKRTASEPKLIELESKEVSFISDREKDFATLNSGDQMEILIAEVKKSKSTKRLHNNQNLGPEINSIFEESNSSFREIFFYHFENILVEFLNKKYNLK